MPNRNWGKAKSFDEIIAVADAASKLAEEKCPEASLIRLAEKIAQRHIRIEEAPELASHSGDGLLFVFKDLSCPIFICVPPMKDDPAFFRFSLYHEIAHIIFGDIKTLDPPDSEDPYQETDEEWLRAIRFAIRMMFIHWKSIKKENISIQEILDLIKSIIQRMPEFDWYNEIKKIIERPLQ
ncbi:MAG: hypothetical protein NTX50_00320 [Candidatus Sumerlaeota bacterium]|nr:hypothetical protein [Candidatus Sumerlaeota bacterium]